MIILTVLLMLFCGTGSAAVPVTEGDGAEAQQLARYEALTIAKQAVRLMEAQKFAEAYTMLKQQYSQHDDDNNLNFLLGQCATALGKPAEAIDYYKKILVVTPDLPRVRLELGRAFAAAGQYAAARVEFQSVLATKPPAVVAEHVKAFLEQMDSQKKLQIRASLGYLYDSNVNAGPDDIIYYNGWTIDNRKRSDHAITTGLFLDYFDQVGPKQAWQTGFSYYRTGYVNMTTQSWDETNLLIGPVFKQGKETISIPAVARFSEIGGQRDSFSWGIAPQLQYELAKDRILTVSTGVMHRRYYSTAERTGNAYSVNVAERWLFGNAGFLELGVGHTRETAEADQFASSYNTVRLTHYRQLPKGYAFVLQPSFTWYGYQGTDPYSEMILQQPAGRRDRQSSLLINFIKTVGDWNYILGCTLTANHSNMDIYRYDRTQLQFQVFRNY